jgi:hypothetical protein
MQLASNTVSVQTTPPLLETEQEMRQRARLSFFTRLKPGNQVFHISGKARSGNLYS